jgi:hypothetical protein
MNRGTFHSGALLVLSCSASTILVPVELIVSVPLVMTLAIALIFEAGFGVAMGLLSWWQFRRKTSKFKRP